MKTPFSLVTLAALLAASSALAVKPSEPPTGLDTSTNWTLAGNSGTSPGVHFLGTTDLQPLQFRVNNKPVFRAEESTLIPSSVNLVSGCSLNFVAPGRVAVTIAGGGMGSYGGQPAYPNGSNSHIASIGGGVGNTIGAQSDSGTISGGWGNSIGTDSENCTIVGGAGNDIGDNSDYATIAGGGANEIANESAGAFIAGGINNYVSGTTSFAAGSSARAEHPGSFVWADRWSTPYHSEGTESYRSEAPNEFRVRATGGVHFHDKTELNFGVQTRQMLNLWKREYAIGVQTGILYQRSANAFAWFKGGAHSNAAYTPGYGGTMLMTLNSGGLAVNGTFISKSDRNAKENFAAVDPKDVLAKVVALPISRWNYKDDEAKSAHVGPMAQDFYAAFKLGADDKHIATVDADGVALAAIQALHAELKEKDAQFAALKKETNERIARLEAMIRAAAKSN